MTLPDGARAEAALRELIAHIERVAYRDKTGLRLGPAVPYFTDAKDALAPSPVQADTYDRTVLQPAKRLIDEIHAREQAPPVQAEAGAGDPRESCERCANVRRYFADGVCNDHLHLRDGPSPAATPDAREIVPPAGHCIVSTEEYEWLRGQMKERDRLAARLREVEGWLREIEVHCPCGARPESPRTHPHVGGCPVYEALSAVGASRPR